MIPQIKEINFPDYATLHQATVTLSDMGERSIETQIRVDGGQSPIEPGVTRGGTFYPMELEFRGERFILPVHEPQAAKDNSSRYATLDLSFRSWVVEELKRYYYFQPASVNASTAIADQYQASVNLSITSFVDNFASVLNYYWPNGEITIDLYSQSYGDEKYLIEIDKIKIWDVLTRFYEIFGKRWYIEAVPHQGGTTSYVIKVNYPSDESEIEHIFQYGYQGGLLKFERQVQDEDITNVLLGRGGEKNLPFRYFKQEIEVDGATWAGDPDAIPELENIYFDRLRDATFRWYVRGWMQTHQSYSGHPTYTEGDIPSSPLDLYKSCLYAFRKGKTDSNFNPVEYVSDELLMSQGGVQSVAPGTSIDKYGEHWGILEDNDEIYPTLQGASGNMDEVVDADPPTDDDIAKAAKDASTEQNIDDLLLYIPGKDIFERTMVSDTFTIPAEKRGNITYAICGTTDDTAPVWFSTEDSVIDVIGENDDFETASGSPIAGIQPGTYRLRLKMVLNHSGSVSTVTGTFGIKNIVLTIAPERINGWKPTFDIWVKNLWNTERAVAESEEDYAKRVWLPILGDHLGKEAAIVFSTGALSVADYEFVIASLPVHDTNKTIWGGSDWVNSHWRITLYKSTAEYDATGLFIPNGSAFARQGDRFYFVGIDMPHMYVIDAENRLNRYKHGELFNVNDIEPGWAVTLDKVRVHSAEDVNEAMTLADKFKTGMLMQVADPRFCPEPKSLYVQSITYRWQEPSVGAPYIVPDIEISLSDKVIPQISTVSRIQGQISSIQNEYIRSADVEEVVRRIASSLFLKKTGEEDTSESPTKFASKVTSRQFVQGTVGGAGWGIYRNNSEEIKRGDATSEGDSVLEIDKVIVRKSLNVSALVVNQVTAVGGKEILSAAKMEVTKVLYIPDDEVYECYFDQKQGSVTNLFMEGDIAMCQRYFPDWQKMDEDDNPSKYYKMVVKEVALDHIVLDETSMDGGSTGVPEVGDVIVQYGSSIASRQSVIVRDVIEGGYTQMVTGLTFERDEETGEVEYSAPIEYFFAGRQYGRNSGRPSLFIGDNDQYVKYDPSNGLSIKGKFSVNNARGSTTIEGDLIQSGELQLGYIANNTLNILAGLSGRYTPGALGQGIAAWYGGQKIDHEASSSAPNYAKTVFRFDGSGYLASGNIHWDSNGHGSIPGVSWDGNKILISNEVDFVLSGQQTESLVETVKRLSNMFLKVEYDTGKYAVKVNPDLFDGLISDGFVTAGGVGTPGGGGGGGATYLYQLEDVDATTAQSPSSGDILYYQNGIWKSVQLTSKLTGYVTTGQLANYALKTDLEKYIKYNGWAHGDSSLYQDADYATLGGWVWANNAGTVIDNTPANYGALMAFGESGNFGPGQIAIASNGVPYFRIKWDGQWTDWRTFVTIDTVQTITGQKTFSAVLYATQSAYVGYGQSSENYANRRLYFGDSSHFIELDANGYFHFSHALYSDSFVSAGGIGSGGGGGGGSTTLAGLSDVSITGTPSNGAVLYYDNGFWRNRSLSTLLGDYVTISGAQTITGQKTFTNSVILAGTSLLFKSADSATSYGSLLIGDGYGQFGVGNAAYMFYPSDGFFFNGGGVPCGASAHRWSNIYSVNGNFSGIVTVNGFNTLDQSNATMSLFNYGARLSKSFNAYGTAFNMRVFDANDNQVNMFYANSYGAGVQSYFVVGDGQTTASKRRIYFGDPNNSKYIELDANGYFHIHGDLYVDGFVSAGGVNANANAS